MKMKKSNKVILQTFLIVMVLALGLSVFLNSSFYEGMSAKIFSDFKNKTTTDSTVEEKEESASTSNFPRTRSVDTDTDKYDDKKGLPNDPRIGDPKIGDPKNPKDPKDPKDPFFPKNPEDPKDPFYPKDPYEPDDPGETEGPDEPPIPEDPTPDQPDYDTPTAEESDYLVQNTCDKEKWTAIYIADENENTKLGNFRNLDNAVKSGCDLKAGIIDHKNPGNNKSFYCSRAETSKDYGNNEEPEKFTCYKNTETEGEYIYNEVVKLNFKDEIYLGAEWRNWFYDGGETGTTERHTTSNIQFTIFAKG